MTARTYYQQQKAAIPAHTMHIHARMLVLLYLTQRYGAARITRHRARICRALHSTDGSNDQ